MDIPRIFTISESEHRIHNPFTEEKYATLGRVLRMKPETRILDLGSGSGEMLCTCLPLIVNVAVSEENAGEANP